jgi:hypothetical protein
VVDYVKTVKQLLERREQLLKQRGAIDLELTHIEAAVRTMVKAFPPEYRHRGETIVERWDKRPMGLTAAVRLSFTDSGKQWLTALDIRDYLESISFSFDEYKTNPLVSIHATLKRIKDELEVKILPNKKKAYRLKAA